MEDKFIEAASSGNTSVLLAIISVVLFLVCVYFYKGKEESQEKRLQMAIDTMKALQQTEKLLTTIRDNGNLITQAVKDEVIKTREAVASKIEVTSKQIAELRRDLQK